MLKPVPLPHQIPPTDDDWAGWVLAAGRGGGKTFAAMLWLSEQARTWPGLRARVIAPTLADAVVSCVEGPNGLLARDPSAVWRPSAPGGSVVTYPNDSRVWILGTPGPREVDRLRALTNIDCDVWEEAAANPRLQEAFDQAALSRRGGGSGAPLRWVASTTPRPLPLIKKWREDPSVRYAVAHSRANTHLDPAWLAEQEERYAGTRLYRQEVEGEILEDVVGALWTLADIERSVVSEVPTFVHTTVGVDPPAGPDTCGIVVVSLGTDGCIYVRDDLSVTDASPDAWARRVVQAAREYDAEVVAEVNQGGRMVTSVLKAADAGLPVRTVHAADSKQARAQPVALKWEAREQTGRFTEHAFVASSRLIAELTEWTPGSASPDRLDAMVWAATRLMARPVSGATVSRHGLRRLPA